MRTDYIFQPKEQQYIHAIADKEKAIRNFIDSCHYNPMLELSEQFSFWESFKDIIGNFHNDISFLATLQAKEFLKNQFGDFNLDVGIKPQGASGLDIDITLSNKKRIIAEIKTTKPYSKGFGAAQKNMIKKDLEKLKNTDANHKYMMVTDEEAFNTLCNPAYFNLDKDIQVVHLWKNKVFSNHYYLE